MQERELVKIKSDNPAHPKGYYTGFKDQLKPGDVIVDASTKKVEAKEDNAIDNGAVLPAKEPAQPKKKVKR